MSTPRQVGRPKACRAGPRTRRRRSPPRLRATPGASSAHVRGPSASRQFPGGRRRGARSGLPGRRCESQGGHHGAKRDGRPRRSLPSTRTSRRSTRVPTRFDADAAAAIRMATALQPVSAVWPAHVRWRARSSSALRGSSHGRPRRPTARCARTSAPWQRSMRSSRGSWSPASWRSPWAWPLSGRVSCEPSRAAARHASEHCSFCSRAWAFWLRASLATTAVASSRPARRGSTRGRSPGSTACMTP